MPAECAAPESGLECGDGVRFGHHCHQPLLPLGGALRPLFWRTHFQSEEAIIHRTPAATAGRAYWPDMARPDTVGRLVFPLASAVGGDD